MNDFNELDGAVRESLLTGYEQAKRQSDFIPVPKNVFLTIMGSSNLLNNELFLGYEIGLAARELNSIGHWMGSEKYKIETSSQGKINPDRSFSLDTDFKFSFDESISSNYKLINKESTEKVFLKYAELEKETNKIYGTIVLPTPFGTLNKELNIGLINRPFIFSTLSEFARIWHSVT